MLQVKIICVVLFLVPLVSLHPVPEDDDGGTTEAPMETRAPLALIVSDEKPSSGEGDGEDGDESGDKTKRHRPTISPEEIEERRKALIKALGGDRDEDDQGGSQIASSLMGLGSLATDLVSLLTSGANETFAPLREARMRARENFPDFGTQLNRFIKNARQYSGRAYKAVVKNTRVTVTNVIRFVLSAVTRLSSAVGGLYQVAVSLLDVATRGLTTGARVGSRLLAAGSNATIRAVAKGTSALRTITESGALLKPINEAAKVGREQTKGLSEDLFDKVEWAQEGLTSKLELVQALAPNFLLRAHENTQSPGESTTSLSTSYGAPSDSDSLGGYSKLTADEDSMVLLKLASTAQELMSLKRDVESVMGDMKNTTASITTTPPSDTGPPQSLLNDIFGLQEEIDDIKSKSTTSSSSSDTPSPPDANSVK